MQSSKLSLVVDRADGQISTAEAIAFVSSAEFGAVDIFVGHVRNVNLGRDVDGTGCVTINIYFPAAAAEKAADRIIDEVWQLRDPGANPAPADNGAKQ